MVPFGKFNCVCLIQVWDLIQHTFIVIISTKPVICAIICCNGNINISNVPQWWCCLIIMLIIEGLIIIVIAAEFSRDHLLKCCRVAI